jgi:hypothetical protein
MTGWHCSRKLWFLEVVGRSRGMGVSSKPGNEVEIEIGIEIEIFDRI